MAPEPPDPKSFSSWEDAFEYPIPAVRGMEKQLRRDIDSNREKLRTLVGASYRDLLGTAESIISMDSQMHDVETYMGEIGKRCNTKILEKKGTNFKFWIEEVQAPNSARYASASQLAVLRSCPNTISRLLKSGGSVLLAAKVLVIARLLHTKFSQRPNSPPYLESLRHRIGGLRRRLLNRIDRQFKHLNISRDALVEAMCAFSLATSSSAKDIQRHYHHIRHEAISEIIAEDTTGHEGMLVALRLYLKTLRDSQAVIPNLLAHALEKLKSVPLLKNQDIFSLVELNLDVHERWIDDSIKNFTPYIRHDDLSKAEAERTLKKWAKEAFSAYLGGLRDQIKDVQDPLALIHLRRQVLDLWLSNHRYSLGIDAAETLDGLRDVFNLQATHVIHDRASKLNRVSAIVQEILQEWLCGVSDSMPSMWDTSMTAMEISNGAKSFRNMLTNRSLGINESLDKVSYEYGLFRSSLVAVEKSIQKLRETKWSDDVDVVDDEEDLLDNKEVLLSDDDPKLLQEELNKALHAAYSDLQYALVRVQPHASDENRAQKSYFLIRTWREVRQHLPQSYREPDRGSSSISELLRIIVDSVLQSPLQVFSIRFCKAVKRGSLASRALWEGDPELPVLPSLWAYRLFHDLSASMTASGSDIWSPYAADTLKKELITRLAPLIRTILEDRATKTNGEVNGDAHDAPESDPDGEPSAVSEGESREADLQETQTMKQPNGPSPNGDSFHPAPQVQTNEMSIQTLFDISYLVNATIVKDLDTTGNDLATLQSKLTADLALEANLVERMKRNAAEYWKRTNLLFGLLA